MTIKTEVETISFIFIASLACVAAIFFLDQKKTPTPVHLVVPFADTIFVSPTPTSIPIQESVTTVSQNSPDGKEIVTLKTQRNGSSTTYTITTTAADTNASKVVSSISTASQSAMTIPFNTFSPNNAYFFLKDDRSDGAHFLVFQTSGENFSTGEKYIDVSQRFAGYTSTYSLADVTGWGDNELLIVNAKSSQGDKASFWFVISSGGWIPLSNYFP